MKEQPPHIEIKVMPTKEVLEKFLQGFHGSPIIIFDSEKGEFVDRSKPKEESK